MAVAATIRTLSPDEWREYRELRLRALAESPDAFETTTEEAAARSDDEWVRRLSAKDGSGSNLPLVAEIGGKPIGLAWGRIQHSTPDTVALYQMWVDPNERGLGAGRMLLEAVIAWARTMEASFVDLGVTWRESPARHLYESAGFRPFGDAEPLRSGSKLRGQPMRLVLRDE